MNGSRFSGRRPWSSSQSRTARCPTLQIATVVAMAMNTEPCAHSTYPPPWRWPNLSAVSSSRHGVAATTPAAQEDISMLRPTTSAVAYPAKRSAPRFRVRMRPRGSIIVRRFVVGTVDHLPKRKSSTISPQPDLQSRLLPRDAQSRQVGNRDGLEHDRAVGRFSFARSTSEHVLRHLNGSTPKSGPRRLLVARRQEPRCTHLGSCKTPPPVNLPRARYGVTASETSLRLYMPRSHERNRPVRK